MVIIIAFFMVIIVIFHQGNHGNHCHHCHHSHHENLVAVRGLRRRPGDPEVLAQPCQEGKDRHDCEEGEGAAHQQGQGIQARPGLVLSSYNVSLMHYD